MTDYNHIPVTNTIYSMISNHLYGRRLTRGKKKLKIPFDCSFSDESVGVFYLTINQAYFTEILVLFGISLPIHKLL